MIPILLQNIAQCLKSFVEAKVPSPYKDKLLSEWPHVCTFIMSLPFQFFYFFWLMGDGPLTDYGFLGRMVMYIHVIVFIILAAFHRVKLGHFIGFYDTSTKMIPKFPSSTVAAAADAPRQE